jgi:hypothetical protein
MRRTIKNTLATFGLFAFMAMLPISCGLVCTDSCGCGPQPVASDFRILSFNMMTLDSNGTEISSETFLPFDQVRKVFGVDNFEMLATSESTFSGFPGFAFACSPLPPKSIESLIDLKIYNTKEVEFEDGTIFKVGDILNDYFEMSTYFSSDAKSISDFLMDGHQLFLDELIQLFFTKNPQKQMVINFNMEFTLETGRKLSLNDQTLSIE